jgi:hypothetical protein
LGYEATGFYWFMFESIIEKVITGMYKSVKALNNKEVTIALKSTYFHPTKTIVSEMVEQLSNYLCDICVIN